MPSLLWSTNGLPWGPVFGLLCFFYFVSCRVFAVWLLNTDKDQCYCSEILPKFPDYKIARTKLSCMPYCVGQQDAYFLCSPKNSLSLSFGNQNRRSGGTVAIWLKLSRSNVIAWNPCATQYSTNSKNTQLLKRMKFYQKPMKFIYFLNSVKFDFCWVFSAFGNSWLLWVEPPKATDIAQVTNQVAV